MSATNEFTATAAQINFDFTMIKYEAPPEYQALNQSLSQRRRENAESGQAHVTVRHLGALFDGISPPTPKLISAYGTRASDIVNDVSARGSLNVSNWMFLEYAGIDATSIWAAATSRKAALPIHLPAYLLARVWDESEATSIWVEIVAERRKELASKFESGVEVPIAQTTAADTSACSWLLTADTVKNLQQKQLLLIVKNISIPFNLENNAYKSIMAAWTSALETMELLISGAPYVVRDGTVLLALSA
ncbi:hypothetical protein B0H63DRAFT_493283 [Podospora didyma]|uniref:Uncharacterized protein n=1 Tax=Podospora didyma TaxID=330526 RepID=A0AAE0NRP5_9PEZI|nr:hypothetical protein B0H63DRAFT_493283 [Podospora didyma]